MARPKPPPLRRIAVLTSGGDAPGMNPVIRAVVRTAAALGLEAWGVVRGYQGLMEGDASPLSTRQVSGFAGLGGTFLQSARSAEFRTAAGLDRAVLSLERLDLDGLVAVGGNGTLGGVRDLAARGVRVVGVPTSIDNDIPGVELSIGVDAALNTIVELVDMIKSTASSHERTFIVEVMGRDCGYLALAAALAVGAEAALLPGRRLDFRALGRHLTTGFRRGKRNSIIICAEGAMGAAEAQRRLAAAYPHETRYVVLGHLQRGGRPSYLTRLMAAELGEAAVHALRAGKTGVVLTLKGEKPVALPLARLLGRKVALPRKLVALAERTGTYLGQPGR